MLEQPHLSFSRTALASILAGSLTLGLTACGSNDGTQAVATNTTVTGTAIAGAVNGEVKVINGVNRVNLASGTVNNGIFSVSLPNSTLTGPLTFLITGTYTDEASGNTVTLDDSAPLALFLAENHFSTGRSGHAPVTPGSSVIYHLIQDHGMTLVDAQTRFQSVFGYLPNTNAVPFDPSALDSATAATRPSIDKDAAFRAGVFSQLAKDLGLTGNDIAALLAGLAEDLSDGALNGENATSAAVIVGNGSVDLKAHHASKPLPARLLSAYSSFAGSNANNAGLAAPITGLPSMSYDMPGSSKEITTASGRNLRITLNTIGNNPIAAGFWTSRVMHNISVVDIDTSQPVDTSTDATIKKISQHPFMNMLSGHNHSTPHAMMADTSNAANGEYVLDSYYLMASVMGMGETARPMGVWNYSINIGEDTNTDGEVDQTTEVMFHPQIKMPMAPMIAEGTTLFSKVSNSNHTWTDMAGITQARPYRLWLQNITANSDSSHGLSVFVSTRNMANMPISTMQGMGDMTHNLMSFPAVYQNQTLQGPMSAMNMRPNVTLASVTVEVSMNAGVSWQTMSAASMDSGRYSTASLAGLSTSEINTLRFRLSVNDGTDTHEMTTLAGDNATLNFIAPAL